jgi:Pan3 Pseudokinase domain
VFHQMDEEGRPILDWGHMIEALNKLDAAVPEQVVKLLEWLWKWSLLCTSAYICCQLFVC